MLKEEERLDTDFGKGVGIANGGMKTQQRGWIFGTFAPGQKLLTSMVSVWF